MEPLLTRAVRTNKGPGNDVKKVLHGRDNVRLAKSIYCGSCTELRKENPGSSAKQIDHSQETLSARDEEQFRISSILTGRKRVVLPS
jgi:hypothetical protein